MKSDMSTPVAEAPASAVPQDPALNLFTFDAAGSCANPEKYAVRVPKRAVCTVLLAQDPDLGAWHFGLELAFSAEDRLMSAPQRGRVGHESREAALRAGLEAAQAFFEASPKDKVARKCAGEVTAQLVALGGSPANTRAQAKLELGPLPAPKNLEVPVAEIEASPHNPRGAVSAADVEELAESIAANGLLQPVGVRIIPVGDGLPGVGATRKELLWGHRRLAAARLKQLPTIAARVYEGISDAQARLLLSIENLQRENLDPIQEAAGFAALMRDFDLTQDEVARQVKKSRPVIANAVRLLDLPPSVQALLSAGRLSLAHGTALCRFKDWPAACVQIAQLAAERGVPASLLERHLPFGEELVDAQLAVDFCAYGCEVQCDISRARKLAKDKRGWFIWEDKERYEDYAYCLDLEQAAQILADEKRKREEAETKRQADRVAAGAASEGGLTAAEKRERLRKLQTNLKNRLEVAAVQHAAMERLSQQREIDVPALLIVCAEAFMHSGGSDLDELAKRLGITVPKDFDRYYYACSHESGDEADGGFAALRKLPAADLLALAAAALVQRDAESAMRCATPPPGYVAMGAQSDAADPVDAPSYVEQWREKITPLVLRGARAGDVERALQCPEFVAVNLVREIRRELQAAGVPLLSTDEAARLERIGEADVRALRSEFAQQWSKTNGELANIFANTTPADVAALRRLDEQEQALARLAKPEAPPEKPKKDKSAKKTKKGGKKK